MSVLDNDRRSFNRVPVIERGLRDCNIDKPRSD
jgi:hypothetical protein